MWIKGVVRQTLRRLVGKEPSMLEVGVEAPAFRATDHRGQTVSLESLRGMYVVLWFYPKADTPG